MDLQNPKWMYLKAAMFLAIGVTCSALVWLDRPTLLTAALLALMSWAFCRAYYFAFYVVEKYVDHEHRFSGLISFLRYMMKQGRGKRV